MNSSTVTAYIGVGSNIGDRKENLDSTVDLLRQTKGINITKISSYLNTAPVGYVEQPDFLNAAIEMETTLSAHELLSVCMDIENRLKRKRTIRWGPRTIDLDILLYGNCIINDENLTIPHPRMHEREFVLKPLGEIAPQAFHTVLGKTVCEMYRDLEEQRLI